MSIGAQVDGTTVAGAVVDVARGVTYSATRGGGAFSDDGSGPVRLRCNAVDEVALALVATGFGYAASRREVQGALIARLLPQIRDIRRVGSAALDLCMVAAGAVDAHYEHGLSPWDWAAGSLIAEEAGAIVQIPDPDITRRRRRRDAGDGAGHRRRAAGAACRNRCVGADPGSAGCFVNR